jgi:DNA-binding YbaB/EbfC family protein
MFDSLKGMAGMAGLLKDLPKIKSRMAEVKRELERVSVESQTGGGAVRVTANGQMRITSIRIDQSMLATLVDASNADDRTMAEDLIAGAVNSALEKAKEAAAAKFSDAAQELNLPIPPGGLAGLLG